MRTHKVRIPQCKSNEAKHYSFVLFQPCYQVNTLDVVVYYLYARYKWFGREPC